MRHGSDLQCPTTTTRSGRSRRVACSRNGHAHGTAEGNEWNDIYLTNERFIESGSAYFSQAFAEALGLASDLELHDTERAQLRIQSIGALLSRAIDQYTTSLDVDDRTGLTEHHEGLLRSFGLDQKGVERVLLDGRGEGYVAADDQFIRHFASLYPRARIQGAHGKLH